MKWYDYIVCVMCADSISAGLVHGELIVLIYGLLQYFGWEMLRKWETSNTQ